MSNRHQYRGASNRRMEDHMRGDQLTEVLDLLSRGAWQEAHAIVQQEKTVDAAWLHGIVHILEGDLENAQHWYRKANRAFPAPSEVQTEIAAARKQLTHGAE